LLAAVLSYRDLVKTDIAQQLMSLYLMIITKEVVVVELSGLVAELWD